jgi:hypothetical protein
MVRRLFNDLNGITADIADLGGLIVKCLNWGRNRGECRVSISVDLDER